ncbi:transcription elongation factor Elf1 like-domain-containing protein [Podospora aff. communis PSN243]|uniref:Transcription elongation factor 1 homolog n=1 Tax=Podospora aff. communis PSN243 TaxID=3040156 RepID=A0AAV9H0V8_9PEZI|nr:transcription elongation factor Elf1 like-domain-containing protein [Podospora aff. communis PSN243]
MGKRKKSSRKPQGPRKNEPLATVFTCLFCNHEKSVSVKLDKKAGVGQLDCKICGQKFQCGINYLSAAVDVYSEWVDAADAVAQGGGNDEEDLQTLSSSKGRLSSGRPGASKGKADAYDDEDDRGGYEGEDVVADDDDY